MSSDITSSTHQEPLPSFDEFTGGTAIVGRLENIHRFTYSVQYQKSSAIKSPESLAALMADGYAVLNDLFESSGVHYLHILEANAPKESASSDQGAGTPLVEFSFDHDRLHCSFRLHENKFEIIRMSSSFADFYAWYSIVMPEAMRIEMTLRQIIERASHGTVRPVQSSYTFLFDLCDFESPNKRDVYRDTRNMDVLEAIIPQIPGPKRTMTRPVDQELYRLDLTLSKREVFGDKARNTWLKIEAPFNQGGRFIVLTAELRNTAAEILEDNRIVRTAGFDSDFGGDYRIALIDFLRDSALESFAWQLLRYWNFGTERQI